MKELSISSSSSSENPARASNIRSSSSKLPTGIWTTLALLLASLSRVGHCQFGSQCEEIKIPMCKNMPYNLTRLPNLLHHSTQENAQLAVDQYELLLWTKCSDQLEFFLCSMYAPICTIEFLNEAIPPCRSVCEAARRGCEPLLGRFNITWPPNLNCASLPLYDSSVCIKPEAIISSDSAPKQEAVEAPCECGRTRKLRPKLYKAREFHYVLRGVVKSVETIGSLTLTTVMVTEVVRSGRVAIQVGKTTYLWTNRSCECPSLTKDTDYIILGWEDFANSRLLYLDGSIAVPYRRRYVRKIKSWEGSSQVTTTVQPTFLTPAVQASSSQLYPDSMQVANSKKEATRRKDRTRSKKKRKKKKRRKGGRRRRRRNRRKKPRERGRDKNETMSVS